MMWLLNLGESDASSGSGSGAVEERALLPEASHSHCQSFCSCCQLNGATAHTVLPGFRSISRLWECQHFPSTPLASFCHGQMPHSQLQPRENWLAM